MEINQSVQVYRLERHTMVQDWPCFDDRYQTETTNLKELHEGECV